MARLARGSRVGVPQHIIQRGNNRQVCFAGEEGMKSYLNWLKEISKKRVVGRNQSASYKGLALGNERFISQIKALTKSE